MLDSVSPRSADASRMIAVSLCLLTLMVYRVSADEIIDAHDIVRQIAPADPGLNNTRGIGVEYASPADDFRRIALPAIEFEFNSDRLTNRAIRQLVELARALRAEKLQSFFFAVQGHTDSIGGEIYNRGLSWRRARTVKRYLSREQGLSENRLVEVGLGEGFPIAGIPSDDERNRRVEVVNLGSTPTPPAAAPAGEGKRVRTKRALLIGIDKYEQVSRLNGPVNDARQMRDFISEYLQYDPEQDIKLLFDEDATRANILAEIENWLIAPTVSGDEVFLFFSGHGYQQSDHNLDEADGLDETWVPVDVAVQKDGSVQGMITDDEIAQQLVRLQGREVYIVIDACHSGTVTRSIGDWRYVKTPHLPDGRPLRLPASGADARTRGVGNTGFQPEQFVFAEAPGVTVWTAVRADQKALVDEETPEHNRSSVFTRRLLWGVRDGRADWNRDGIVIRRELQSYVLKQSLAYCERHKTTCDPSRGLTPQFYASTAQVFQEPAFGLTRTALPRAAALAKDILISPPDSNGVPSEDRLQLSMKPASKIRVGAELEIVVESDRDGHLVLLDIDANNRLVQVFPNELGLKAGFSPWIQAGRPMTVPGEGAGFRYRATPPTGRGELIAVVSKENPRVGKLTSRYKDLSVVPNSEAYLVELWEALRRGAAEQEDRAHSEWIMGKIKYEIVSQ